MTKIEIKAIFNEIDTRMDINVFTRIVNLVTAYEREQCDQLCQDIDGGDNMFARAIRARGNVEVLS